MNQDQRKFLIERVTQTCKKQIDVLKGKIPHRPSLNNYLIASFLDDTIKFNDLKKLKEKIRDEVIRFGTDDRLVTEDTRSRRKGRRHWSDDYDNDEDSVQNLVQIEAESLFVIPEAYTKALAEYQLKKDEIMKEIERLDATKETIIMKLQIGSASTMEKLVMQVDSLGDLDLMNSQLMLSQTTNKQIEGTKK